MSQVPVTIEEDATVAEAQVLMRERNIRHLPVTRGGRLVGLVSERDLYLLLSLSGTEAEKESIVEAMTEAPYTVRPDDALAEVAREMAAKKYGSAVVIEGGQVVGVLTTVDALRSLALILFAKERHAEPVTPEPAKA